MQTDVASKCPEQHPVVPTCDLMARQQQLRAVVESTPGAPVKHDRAHRKVESSWISEAINGPRNTEADRSWRGPSAPCLSACQFVCMGGQIVLEAVVFYNAHQSTLGGPPGSHHGANGDQVLNGLRPVARAARLAAPCLFGRRLPDVAVKAHFKMPCWCLGHRR